MCVTNYAWHLFTLLIHFGSETRTVKRATVTLRNKSAALDIKDNVVGMPRLQTPAAVNGVNSNS